MNKLNSSVNNLSYLLQILNLNIAVRFKLNFFRDEKTLTWKLTIELDKIWLPWLMVTGYEQHLKNPKLSSNALEKGIYFYNTSILMNMIIKID